MDIGWGGLSGERNARNPKPQALNPSPWMFPNIGVPTWVACIVYTDDFKTYSERPRTYWYHQIFGNHHGTGGLEKAWL